MRSILFNVILNCLYELVFQVLQILKGDVCLFVACLIDLFRPSESVAASVAIWEMGMGPICKQHL